MTGFRLDRPDASGRFGEFGGRFAPETLMPALIELEREFVSAWSDQAFVGEFHRLLREYVGRPTPMHLAARLSKRLGVELYLKREDLAHTGAHKINNALGQGLLAKRMGKPRVIAETGAGQHGVATATAASFLGLECAVYMGEVDIERQALNVFRMRLLGAEVIPVTSGARTLKDAVSEAMRDWVRTVEDTHYRSRAPTTQSARWSGRTRFHGWCASSKRSSGKRRSFSSGGGTPTWWWPVSGEVRTRWESSIRLLAAGWNWWEWRQVDSAWRPAATGPRLVREARESSMVRGPTCSRTKKAK